MFTLFREFIFRSGISQDELLGMRNTLTTGILDSLQAANPDQPMRDLARPYVERMLGMFFGAEGGKRSSLSLVPKGGEGGHS